MVARVSVRGDRVDTLPRSTRRRIWWRCLGLQATWNNQRMQNLGLLAVLSPWARGRGLDADRRRRLARRHVVYFNTNPYLAGYVVGGLLRLEDDRREGVEVPETLVTNFRDSLSRACGAIGDELFWLALRPMVLMLALLAGWLVAWPLALAVVGLFAGAELWLRWRGLWLAYRLGPDVVDVLSRPGWYRAVAWSRRLALGLTGFLAGYYFAGGLGGAGAPPVGHLLALVVIGLGIPIITRQRRAGETQFLVGVLIVAGSVLLF